MKEGFLEATESKIQWAKDEFLRAEDPAGYKASPWPMVEELIAEVRRLRSDRRARDREVALMCAECPRYDDGGSGEMEMVDGGQWVHVNDIWTLAGRLGKDE